MANNKNNKTTAKKADTRRKKPETEPQEVKPDFVDNMKTLWAEMKADPSHRGDDNMTRGEVIRFGTGAVILLLSCFIILCIVSHLFTAPQDNMFQGQEGWHAQNWMGAWGLYTARFFIDQCWGVASVLIPVFMLTASLRIMQVYRVRLWKWFLNCTVLMVWLSAAGSVIQPLLSGTDINYVNLGGSIGQTEIQLLTDKTGEFGMYIILLVLAIIYLIYLSRETIHIIRAAFHPKSLFNKNGEEEAECTGSIEGEECMESKESKEGIESEEGTDRKDTEELTEAEAQYLGLTPEETATTIQFTDGKTEEKTGKTEDVGEVQMEISGGNEEQPDPNMIVTKGKEEAEAHPDENGALEPYDPKLDLENYDYPTLDLLQHYDIDTSIDMEEQQANKNRIIQVLCDFGVKISSIKATVGPTITLYEITPAPGIRISKIRNLEDDIALSLSAIGIRIIAPIPGKGTIGIEVPNAKPQIVSMESILNSRKFQESKFELPMALGKTITNEIYMADLAKMPHLLVAGATGQGKSVGLNAIITSLLYKKHPAELKLVMVDPKKVEFSVYSPIVNHFLAQVEGNEDDEPIITDVQKVVQTLKSLCVEMDSRYDLLKKARSRNIKEYNAKFKARQLNPKNGHRFMPYIVVVIDEFGDLIMTAGKEVELPICRIAQLARAVGIHMIIATQRPTTNIITGTIKANFPARMAFKVTSMVDSRTILDSGGAQQLVGKGDMLFLAGSQPVRVQCAFVDTPEVERIATFIACQQSYNGPAPLPPVPMEGDDDSSPDVDMNHLDPMFEEVARLVVSTQQGSTSMIQRKFSIGYNRAGRLMDQLEVAGIVGPAHGSKPREVLCMGDMELDQLLMNMR